MFCLQVEFPDEAENSITRIHEALGDDTMSQTVFTLATLGMALLIGQDDSEEVQAILRAARTQILFTDLLRAFSVDQ